MSILRRSRRTKEKSRELETEPEFYYRGSGNSRIENLSDTVFGFGVTLLIVSLKVPESFGELKAMFDGFFAFGIAVMLFFGLWYEHYIFFIRYGLKDRVTVLLNGILLFVLLFFIYPLKFLVSILVQVLKAGWSELTGDNGMQVLERMMDEMIGPEQIPELMVLYGWGGAAVYGLFAALYFNALLKRNELALNVLESKMTRLSLQRNLFAASVPFLSALLAYWVHPPPLAAILAGMVYGLMGFMALFGIQERKLKQRTRRDPSHDALGQGSKGTGTVS